LILLSRDKPHVADARYTKNQAWKSKKVDHDEDIFCFKFLGE